MEEDYRIEMIMDAYAAAISYIPGLRTAMENLAFDETPIPQSVRDARTDLIATRDAEIANLPPLEEAKGQYEPNVSKTKQ